MAGPPSQMKFSRRAFCWAFKMRERWTKSSISGKSRDSAKSRGEGRIGRVKSGYEGGDRRRLLCLL